MAGWRPIRLENLFSVSDEQAMLRVQNDADPNAFAVLVQRWESAIQRLCLRMTGDLNHAEELAQETFTRLFERRKQYRRDSRFGTYLRRIAVNICYDFHRKRRRRPSPEVELDMNLPAGSHDAADLGAPPEALAMANERADFVRGALDQLAEHHRTVVVLRHYEGLKFREIAAVMEIPEGTVKSRMAEALTQLGRLLGTSLGEEVAPKRRGLRAGSARNSGGK